MISGMAPPNGDAIVATLIAGGADPNVVDLRGRTALHGLPKPAAIGRRKRCWTQEPIRPWWTRTV